MPLPPALAARLAKRGLLSKKRTEDEEEVFAESYDDHDDRHKGSLSQTKKDNDEARKYMGHPGCPNKCNPYHQCLPFCSRFWGPGHPEPSKEYLEVHYRLMATYGPLPDGWKEMYDPGTGRYFFWCTRTDKVDWFPPGHPRCNLLEPAARVREGIILMASTQAEEQEMDIESDADSDDSDSDREDKRREQRRKPTGDRRAPVQRNRPSRPDHLDPMDPAAYSDTPRGDWSTGLERARESGPPKVKKS